VLNIPDHFSLNLSTDIICLDIRVVKPVK
jgi:hypothetical protein